MGSLDGLRDVLLSLKLREMLKSSHNSIIV